MFKVLHLDPCPTALSPIWAVSNLTLSSHRELHDNPQIVKSYPESCPTPAWPPCLPLSTYFSPMPDFSPAPRPLHNLHPCRPTRPTWPLFDPNPDPMPTFVRLFCWLIMIVAFMVLGIQRNLGITNLKGPAILFFIARVLLLQGIFTMKSTTNGIKKSTLLQEFFYRRGRYTVVSVV